jgi:hypothetical protein
MAPVLYAYDGFFVPSAHWTNDRGQSVFNMATGKMGLVGISDAIGFDEVADLQKMPKEVVTTLKATASRGDSPVERIPCLAWLLSPCSGTRPSRSK